MCRLCWCLNKQEGHDSNNFQKNKIKRKLNKFWKNYYKNHKAPKKPQQPKQPQKPQQPQTPPSKDIIVNGKLQELRDEPYFAEVDPVKVNGKEVYITTHPNNSGQISSDAPPLIVKDYAKFTKNMKQIACGWIKGKKLEYEMDKNCKVDLDACKRRGDVCTVTYTTRNDGESVKICCKWQ